MVVLPFCYPESMSYELKTKQNEASVEAYLGAIEDPQRQADCRAVCTLMEELTGEPAKMWGTAIVGFGSYHYTYASGQSGDWPPVAFSSRKQNLTIYLGGYERFADLLAKLGPHKLGKSCLYLKRLSGVDQTVLRQLISNWLAYYPTVMSV